MRHRRGLTLGVFLATVLCVRLTAWAGLLGYWAFDDPGNPNTALDVSGAGNHGSVVGATYSGDGGGHTGNSGDTAMNFGTSNNGARVSLPTAASGAFTSTGASNAATISLWIHGDSTQPQEDAAFNFSEPGGPGDPRRLMSHIPWSNQNIYWDVGGCCGATFRINKAEPDATKWEGEWNHYVFVKDGTTGQSSRIYQNGALWHSGATSAIIGNITAAVIGASDTNGGSSYGGLIDDFAIWDQVLTADQIQNLYDKTKTPLNVLIDGDLTSQQNGYWDQAGTWVGTMVGVPTANTAVTVDSNLVTCRQTTDVGGSLDVVGTGQVTIQSGKKLTLSWRPR